MLDGEEILKQLSETPPDPDLPDLTASLTGRLNISSVPLNEYLYRPPRKQRDDDHPHTLYRNLGGTDR